MSHINELQHTLKKRHITMIALGGVIGAGLFVGSGAIISTAGPAAILSYLIAGIIVTLVMFMLGEMAARNPDAGSFSVYASTYLGQWAGYTVGWLYWFKWMITIAIEALLLGSIIHDFLPFIPIWVGAFAMTVIVISSNVYSVRSFAEFEYWLSFAKVATIIIFLALGISILLGFQNNVHPTVLSDLTASGGFMPNGMSPVLAGVIVVIFSLGGSEIAAVASGESEDPRKNVIKAIRSVVVRVLVFYVGSVLILILCVPWTDKAALKSPYVSLFSMAGFPLAAIAIKIVLFISFMSVMNSGMYSASRMLFSLSRRGYAPALFSKTTSRGVPLSALALSLIVCSAVLVVHFLSGGDLFLTLAKSSGSFIIVVWLFIAFAHLSMRRGLGDVRRGERQFQAWFYPYSNWLAIAALVTVLLSQATNPASRFQFGFTILVFVVVIASYLVLRNRPLFGMSRVTAAGDPRRLNLD
ncbi:amino acid permease [Paraburkholderia aromaticivorans]|uniref:amino acid permease n=1 Tax=Paraburkholderia aromaticivorans TaxID=2026199 RepID=UPI001455E68F|nr:amino acid permease [Paraburkholderia aromaticivorans]